MCAHKIMHAISKNTYWSSAGERRGIVHSPPPTFSYNNAWFCCVDMQNHGGDVEKFRALPHVIIVNYYFVGFGLVCSHFCAEK